MEFQPDLVEHTCNPSTIVLVWMRNALHSLRYLNAWSPDGGTVVGEA